MIGGITTKQAIAYAALPGIRPRLREFLSTGFQFIPYMVALIFQSVRLLPAQHAYINGQNLGKFGIRHVLAEAANNLELSRKNIDQIIVYGVILVGMVLLALQVAMLIIAMFAGPVSAQGMPSFADLFITENPEQDLAFIMMDMVFGVEGIFESCVSTGGNCTNLADEPIQKIEDGTAAGWLLNSLSYPFPIHYAMHALFRFFSLGLLIVATFITLYFMATVILETAQTGTPFGKRFNKVWVPVRIVMAFGLLVPIGGDAGGDGGGVGGPGLNASQYIVLYAAKFGSSFATNGWLLFNEKLSETNVNAIALGDGDQKNLISKPNVPNIESLLQFMYTAQTCKALDDIKQSSAAAGGSRIKMYLVRDPLRAVSYQEVTDGTNYEDVLNFADGEHYVHIRFGEHDPAQYKNAKGHVSPICGEIVFSLTDPRSTATTENPPEPAAARMQKAYWNLLRVLKTGGIDIVFPTPGGGPLDFTTINVDAFGEYPKNTALYYGNTNTDTTVDLPDGAFKTNVINVYKDQYLENAINEAVTEQINAERYTISGDLIAKGWGGAGIWYNKIAELNGVVSAAVNAVPSVTRYPSVMEKIREEKSQQNRNPNQITIYKPDVAGDQEIKGSDTRLMDDGEVLWQAYNYWQQGGLLSSPHTQETGTPILDVINQMFGTEGLYSMRRNEGVHPLAQLVGVGRSLVESAVRNFGYAAGGAGLSGIIGQLGGAPASAISFIMTFVIIGLTIGFVLFYLIPFLPFIYFFFAVAGWVKGIFEAMIGAPLWALAHIRIDGEGLQGSAALNGYLLILEIFLRPILIVFGMLASISTFSALVSVLNSIWNTVLTNVAGFDPTAEADAGGESLIDFARGPVDEFFYTVLYTIVVYLLATSSFKLIDSIPQKILRWAGQSVQTFNDARDDPTQGLVGSAGAGGQQVLQKVGGETSNIMQQTASGKFSGSTPQGGG